MNKKIVLYIVIILVIIVISFCVLNFKPTNNVTNKINVDAQNIQNVVNDESTTTATFTGYYAQIKNVYGEENTGPFTCDEFIVKKTDDPLFQFLAKWSPGTIISNGDMRLTIYLGQDTGEKVSTAIKEKIITSTKENPTSITVQKIEFVGKGLPACGSVVKILSAQ